MSDAYRLLRVNDRLTLCRRDDDSGVCLRIDDLQRRVRQGRKLALAKACGVRPGLRVLDGMAGLGLDGMTLATLGCDVLMVERNPLLAELLADAVTHIPMRIDVAGAAVHRFADVRDVLAEARHFDAIYLDPMFPARDKHALPRKPAQVLSDLIGVPDDDLPAIVAASIALAGRVVVKRRRHDAAIGRPDWQILGRSVRFDVYRGLVAVNAGADGSRCTRARSTANRNSVGSTLLDARVTSPITSA